MDQSVTSKQLTLSTFESARELWADRYRLAEEVMPEQRFGKLVETP